MLGNDDQANPHQVESLGRAIARLRKQAGYTNQRDFGAVVGVSESMISHVETGRRLPSKDTLDGILDAVRADNETRRRLKALLEQSTSPPLEPGLAVLRQLVATAVGRLERRFEQLDRRIEQLERRRGR